MKPCLPMHGCRTRLSLFSRSQQRTEGMDRGYAHATRIPIVMKSW